MRISVVGSLNMDMTVTAPRIPQKGETILGEALNYFPGGKGANQAYALGKLGADVVMYGCVGRDDFGRQLIDNLAQANVETSGIRQLDTARTGVALITVGESDNTIVVVPGANGMVDRSYIDTISPDLLRSDLVMLQLEIPLETVLYICDMCAAAGVPVLLNPAPAIRLPQTVLDQVTLITPNEHEAALVYDHDGPIEELLARYPEKLVVTLGKAGSVFADRNGNILRTAAGKARVVDTTGAGDTFNAALAFAMTSGYDLAKAMVFANTAAGISTEKMGAQAGMPTFDEVMARQDRLL
ncbi:MAG: ribokinase [Bacillota bacterium]|nr:ribokinase [Bacillota bacterium]